MTLVVVKELVSLNSLFGLEQSGEDPLADTST